MKRRAYTLLEFAVTLSILALVAALVVPQFNRAREAATPPQCVSHLKQIGLAALQYAQDYDEHYPPKSVAWAWALQPRVKNWQIFQCDADPQVKAEQTTDYFFNAHLSGIAQIKMPRSAATIMAGDGLSDQPPATTIAQLPNAWLADPQSPAHRHRGGANYLFADGHVKRLIAAQIKTKSPLEGEPTFEVKP